MSNAADEDQVAAGKKREFFDQLEDEHDLTWIMSDIRGRRWIWNHLTRAGLFQLSFAGELTHATAFNEGRRNEGIRLMNEITQRLPELYLLMLQESQKRAQELADRDQDTSRVVDR